MLTELGAAFFIETSAKSNSNIEEVEMMEFSYFRRQPKQCTKNTWLMRLIVSWWRPQVHRGPDKNRSPWRRTAWLCKANKKNVASDYFAYNLIIRLGQIPQKKYAKNIFFSSIDYHSKHEEQDTKDWQKDVLFKVEGGLFCKGLG